MTIIERIRALSIKLLEKNIAPTEVWLGLNEQQELIEYLMSNYSYNAAPMAKIVDGKTRIGNLVVRKAAAQSCLRVGYSITDKSNNILFTV